MERRSETHSGNTPRLQCCCWPEPPQQRIHGEGESDACRGFARPHDPIGKTFACNPPLIQIQRRGREQQPTTQRTDDSLCEYELPCRSREAREQKSGKGQNESNGAEPTAQAWPAREQEETERGHEIHDTLSHLAFPSHRLCAQALLEAHRDGRPNRSHIVHPTLQLVTMAGIVLLEHTKRRREPCALLSTWYHCPGLVRAVYPILVPGSRCIQLERAMLLVQCQWVEGWLVRLLCWSRCAV